MTHLRLPYVHRFRDRHGKLRHYFRRGGSPRIALPGLPGSAEFMEAYQAASAGVPAAVEIGANRTKPGTINSLVISYYKSDDWLFKLEEDTRRTRRRFIERFRAEHGDKRVALLRREHIVKMLGALGRPSAKMHWFKAIRGLMRAAVPSFRHDDPTDGIPPPAHPKSKGHHTWTDEEIAQYRAHWPLGTQQRLVMEFALETYSRRGEVVRLGPQHVRHGRIRIERTHGSADVDIPMSPELQAACEAMPKAHLTYVVTASGKPR